MRLLLLIIAINTALQATTVAEQLKLNGPTMGTYYSVVVDSPPEGTVAAKLDAKVRTRLAEINQQMSTWDESSEISKFNASASSDWFEISTEFAAVATEAKRIHEQTNGAFDPTVSPLIDLWGFGDRRKKAVPNKTEIANATAMIGMQHLSVRTDPPAIKKAIPDLQLNLSAIAKGYAVDAIADLLTTEGLVAFVVDIGGENRAGLAKSSGDSWKIGIESPLGGLKRILPLTESSIATSGDYRNYFDIDGTTYSHAIDPTTGWPVKNPPASVSVIHKSCMTADAWATAMMVMGEERGIEIAKENQLSILFQTVSADNIVESTSGSFATDTAGGLIPGDEHTAAETAITNSQEPPQTEKTKSATARWFPFAAAAVIFLIAVTGMAIGTILQNKSIKGSCGGLASMPGSEGKSICELCTIPKNECTNTELREMMQAANAQECDEHDS